MKTSPRFGPELLGSPGASDPPALADHAAALAIWGEHLDEGVALAGAAAEHSDDPVHHFRLGVVLRMRHDSAARRPGDFAGAVAAWSRALAMDPNQYIWRRRLQQYGPRSSKPYPFYDWVSQARTEIRARGERPVELIVEPQGAEYAAPVDQPLARPEVEARSEPDPRGRVHGDEGLIQAEAVVIPPRARPGDTVRVHLILTPNKDLDAHWNNESGDGELWVRPPEKWEVDHPHQFLPTGPGEISAESRHIEFEIVTSEEAVSGGIVSGHLLYFVCEGASGICSYRRQELRVPIHIESEDDTTPLAG